MLQITKGKIKKAQKVVLYGPEGIGKSTFASGAPDPLFIDTEGSTTHLDIARFPKPQNWGHLVEMVRYVGANPNTCNSLVIDTIDWAERLATDHLCALNNIKTIGDLQYGVGYLQLENMWGVFLDMLTDLTDLGVNVILLAHAQMRKFERPDEMGAYDRWELKLEKKTAALTKEWGDCLLFANYEVTLLQDSKTKSKKAQGGQRVMFTSHHPAWDAKNRYGLPDKVPFSIDPILPFLEVRDTKEVQEVQEVQEEVIQEEIKESTPKEKLFELMEKHQIKKEEIEGMVTVQGYFPQGTDLNAYPDDFINQVLLGAWDQLLNALEIYRKNY